MPPRFNGRRLYQLFVSLRNPHTGKAIVAVTALGNLKTHNDRCLNPDFIHVLEMFLWA